MTAKSPTRDELKAGREALDAHIISLLKRNPGIGAADIIDAADVPELLIEASKVYPPKDRRMRIVDAALQRLRKAGLIRPVHRKWHLA